MKTYQPFIIRISKEMMEILDDSVPQTEQMSNRLCDILTEKFIKGEITSESQCNEVMEVDEILSFINEGQICEHLAHLKELGLVGEYDDDGEPSYFLTEEGKKYVEEMMKNE